MILSLFQPVQNNQKDNEILLSLNPSMTQAKLLHKHTKAPGELKPPPYFQFTSHPTPMVMVHRSNAHYKPDEPDSKYKWTEYQCLLVTLCHVP